jgi:hypothetical protein
MSPSPIKGLRKSSAPILREELRKPNLSQPLNQPFGFPRGISYIVSVRTPTGAELANNLSESLSGSGDRDSESFGNDCVLGGDPESEELAEDSGESLPLTTNNCPSTLP